MNRVKEKRMSDDGCACALERQDRCGRCGSGLFVTVYIYCALKKSKRSLLVIHRLDSHPSLLLHTIEGENSLKRHSFPCTQTAYIAKPRWNGLWSIRSCCGRQFIWIFKYIFFFRKVLSNTGSFRGYHTHLKRSIPSGNKVILNENRFSFNLDCFVKIKFMIISSYRSHFMVHWTVKICTQMSPMYCIDLQ